MSDAALHTSSIPLTSHIQDIFIETMGFFGQHIPGKFFQHSFSAHLRYPFALMGFVVQFLENFPESLYVIFGKYEPLLADNVRISPVAAPTGTTPQPIASINTRPNCSLQRVVVLDGSAKTCHLRKYPGTSKWSTHPKNSTRSSIPRDRARRSSVSRSSPSPTICAIHSPEKPASALKRMSTPFEWTSRPTYPTQKTSPRTPGSGGRKVPDPGRIGAAFSLFPAARRGATTFPGRYGQRPKVHPPGEKRFFRLCGRARGEQCRNSPSC